jgi:autotransporter passenger strand-loop-strand repeat protein
MTVSAGGVLSVYAGANLAATAILDGASEVLVSGSLGTGGIQTNLVLEAGSSALNTIVGSGGALIALASGTWVGNTTVLDGGKLLVSSGATASAAVIASGGSAAVADGDVANSITLSSGATLIVSSGGAAGLLPLSSGGSATLQGNIVDNSVVALALSGGTAVIDSATLYGQGLFEVTGSGTYVVGDGTSFHGSTIVSASGAGAPADQVTMIVPGGAVISNVFDYGEVVSVSGGGATLNTSVLPDVQSGR